MLIFLLLIGSVGDGKKRSYSNIKGSSNIAHLYVWLQKKLHKKSHFQIIVMRYCGITAWRVRYEAITLTEFVLEQQDVISDGVSMQQ